jgi:hypothetical protein
MKFRPDLRTWVSAISTVVVLAFGITMQFSDGVFHLPLFVLALAVVSGFLLVGLMLFGALRLLVGGRRRREEAGAPDLGEMVFAALGEQAAATYWDYSMLRVRIMADPTVVVDQEFRSAAEEVVAELGPAFDARVSAWSRLDSLEPNLRALAMQAVDQSSEEPMDVESFADGVLLVRLAQPRLITPEDWWTFAASLCLLHAVGWRTTQPGRGRDAEARAAREVLPEVSAVVERLFAFGDETWWDVDRDTTIDPGALRGAGDGPYQTRADDELQLVVFSTLMSQLRFHSERCPVPGGEDQYVSSIEQVEEEVVPDDLLRIMASAVPGSWFERWTLACGRTRLPFAVAFMPGDDGNTSLAATLIE